MASLAMPFDASVDMAAQQAYARLVASLGGNENAVAVSWLVWRGGQKPKRGAARYLSRKKV
jgi:hypothetical protein